MRTLLKLACPDLCSYQMATSWHARNIDLVNKGMFYCTYENIGVRICSLPYCAW